VANAIIDILSTFALIAVNAWAILYALSRKDQEEMAGALDRVAIVMLLSIIALALMR